MRPEPNHLVDPFRTKHPKFPPTGPGENHGFFVIKLGPKTIRIISSGFPVECEPQWEHVSVALHHECPNWSDMKMVKDLFWGPEETVIQYHPPASVYVDAHPFCLHLWKPVGVEIPVPPTHLIA